jgi:hypothetical protein
MKYLTKLNESLKKGDVIAVDFDGVIHGYSKGWQKGIIYDAPVPGCKEALEQLRTAGYKIWVFSARQEEAGIKEYMEKNDLPYDRIHMGRKPMQAALFIDDKAITFTGNWDQTLKDVENFLPWTKK